METVRIGVLIDQSAAQKYWRYGLNVFSRYIGEMLSAAGISFEWVTDIHHILDKSYDILFAGAVGNDEFSSAVIWKYAERGGIVISFGGLNALAKKLGCVKSTFRGCGYAKLSTDIGDPRPLRFLQATPWVYRDGGTDEPTELGVVGTDKYMSDVAGAALQQFQVGEGFIDRWSVDIPSTVVQLQQGLGPVLEDGAPDPKGYGQINEGILKADDLIAMDWDQDRELTETGAYYFAHPYADLWKEVVLNHLLKRVGTTDRVLAFVDYWPEGIDRVAVISHDSDRNQDGDAVTTMEVLKEVGIQSTWCMMKPGYSQYLYSQIQQAGHELALHYNAMEGQGGYWILDDLKRQANWLRETIGLTEITSNKNHFTRFEGWGELFAWCESCGIKSDQTRGPSKRGNVGFLFGTCRPYFPIAWSNEQNRLYDVLEIGFLTQDIPDFTGADVVTPFLEQVSQVRGVAHFLFHQGRIHDKPEIADALRLVVKRAYEQGFVFWTNQQINDWERSRRGIRILGIDADGSVILERNHALPGTVYWRTIKPGERHGEHDVLEQRFGVVCKKIGQSQTEDD